MNNEKLEMVDIIGIVREALAYLKSGDKERAIASLEFLLKRL